VLGFWGQVLGGFWMFKVTIQVVCLDNIHIISLTAKSNDFIGFFTHSIRGLREWRSHP
jgi:hypothetical protein